MILFSSIPRSGSSLLSSLLNQRPDVYSTATSNLSDTLSSVINTWKETPTTSSSQGTEEDLMRVLRGIVNNRYPTDKLVFDKDRRWPKPEVLQTMHHVLGGIKVIATVRPIAECFASFVRLMKPDDVRDFCMNSNVTGLIFDGYNNLKAGYEQNPEAFLFIEYDDLVSDTQSQMNRISEFTGIPRFIHDTNNIPPSNEKDEVWEIEDLHLVRPIIGRTDISAEEVLGKEMFDYFQGGEFWNDKPEPFRPKNDPLDLQLEASLRGDFKKASEITDQLLKARPNCNRTKFNAGWHELYKGNLLSGHKLLDYGREEGIFGSHCLSNRPRWCGEKGTVLINMEGGLGDEIMNLRYAKIIEKTNKVVLACSAELASIFAEQHITVQHEALPGVYHDYYVPSMSVTIPLGFEYKDVSGKNYIDRVSEPVPGRVGVRWQGNPVFDHDTHRKFPSELMFDVVRDQDCVSLQRDTDDVPKWMKQPSLETWDDTRKAISECELVISSCTCVAHLAAAMGVPTWIVIPILPYYIWARPGNKSIFYDSVTLFRQEKYGDWSAPFEQIKEKLKCYTHTLKMAA